MNTEAPHQSPDIQTDSELLMRYVRARDENAFRQLVHRHGPLVMSVCRQVLQNEQDAEDAFQATFLIVSRRAETIMHLRTAAGWIHKVVFRTALRVRKRRLRHKETELLENHETPEQDAFDRIHLQQLTYLLHEELARLPARYREVIVLCDLGGITRAAAAESLDRTESSVKASLARGRRQLRVQLMKRGAMLSVACWSAARIIRSITLRHGLIDNTVALVQSTPGTSVEYARSVFSVAEEGIKMMKITSIGTAAGVSVVVLILLAVPLRIWAPAAQAQDTDELTIALDATEDSSSRSVELTADAPAPNTPPETSEELMLEHYRLLEKSLQLKKESLLIQQEQTLKQGARITRAGAKRLESEIVMIDAEIAKIAAQKRETVEATSIPDTRSKLKPGDKIDVAFVGGGFNAALSRRVTILADGKIILPYAGQIDADGVTLNELKTRISLALEGIINQPEISVLVTFAGTSEPLFNVVEAH